MNHQVCDIIFINHDDPHRHKRHRQTPGKGYVTRAADMMLKYLITEQKQA